MKDVEREEEMFSEGRVITQVGILEWIKLTAGTEEGEVVVFRVMIKGGPGGQEPKKLMSLGLVDKGAGLSAPPKGIKLILAMVSLEYMGILPSGPP